MATTGLNSILTVEELEKEKISEQEAVLKELYSIWNNVGIDEERKVNRANQVWKHVLELLQEIVDEEAGFYEDIKERIINYEKRISEMTVELQLPETEVVICNLVEKEEILRLKVDELTKIKHKRLKEFQELHLQEFKFCKILGMPPLNLSSTTGVPAAEDICKLKQHIALLKEEMETRQEKFYRLKKELSTIMEVTELTPETTFEKEILNKQENTLSLSPEIFKQLEEIVTKTKNKKSDLENEKSILMQKLSALWDILKVDEKERIQFSSTHSDCRISNLNAIKEEIAHCEKIKAENISKYVGALQEELSSLWDKCFITPSETMLLNIQDGEINECLLEMYENEILKWKKYYNDTEDIIQNIGKRKELWDQLMSFENKAEDPNRFKNRGGNLLREERQRKQLQKVLPELEEKILIEIENYERETGKQFLYFGERFVDFMEKQWKDRLHQKENKKMRLKLNERTADNLAKRPLLGMTPKSAPSKLCKSSSGIPIYRIPNCRNLKQVPSTIARLRNTKQECKTPKKDERKVLKEKSGNELSDCLDSTTYTEFAEKLERSSRITHRSSVLTSKKIAGTRISLSNSKKKNENKSTHKFPKKIDISKLTAARGKSGLPFLI